MIMNAAPITSKAQNPVNALQLGTAWDFHLLGSVTPPNSDAKWCPAHPESGRGIAKAGSVWAWLLV